MARTVKEQIGVDLPEKEPLEPAVEPQEPAEGTERPDWLPENFSKPEDLAASYKESQNRIREQAEAQKAMEGQLTELTRLVEGLGQPQPQQQSGDVNEQLMAAYENDPIGTVVFLAAQAAQQQFAQLQQQNQPQFQAQQQLQGELTATTAGRMMEAKFSDWNDYEAKVGALIDKNPGLLPNETLLSLEKTTDTLEAIYKQVKYDDLVHQIEQSNNGQNGEQMKRQAQTISGNSGKPGQPSEVDDKMARLIAAAKGSSYSAFRSG